jgi:hypothetical protein
MNTITINNTTTDGAVTAVTYNEAEVKDLLKKAEELSEAYRQLTRANSIIRDIKDNIHSFFSEVEWTGGEQTVVRSELNDLFERCGIRKLQAKYSATVTVTLTVTDFEADSEDDLEYDIQNELDISIGNGEVDIEGVEVCNVEEA